MKSIKHSFSLLFQSKKEMAARIKRLENCNLSLATETEEIREAAQDLIQYVNDNVGFSSKHPIEVIMKSNYLVWEEYQRRIGRLNRLTSSIFSKTLK